MPRTTPPSRATSLLVAAAAVFVEHGYARAQMDDVAARLQVSKGTVYRAVQSKDALLAAVVRWGDDPAPPHLPLDAGDVANVARDLIATLAGEIDALALASPGRRSGRRLAFGDEVETIARDLHRVLAGHRTAIMVLDRCAPELASLTDVWFGRGRYALIDLWADYLDRRPPSPDTSAVGVEVLARSIVELITLWAVKLPWDPSPRAYPDDTSHACGVMVRHLATGNAS